MKRDEKSRPRDAVVCILCLKAPATTREHVFKADVYREIFGNDPAHFFSPSASRPKLLKSSKNRLLAPVKNLCLECNSARSAASDKAFAAIDSTLRSGLERVADAATLESLLVEAFEKNAVDWKDFLRYFAKHLACHLHRVGYEVPDALRELFLSGANPEVLKVSFAVDGSKRGQRVLRNFVPEARIAGLDRKATLGLVGSGILPEGYFTALQHGAVQYRLSLNVPELEVTSSAQRGLVKVGVSAIRTLGGEESEIEKYLSLSPEQQISQLHPELMALMRRKATSEMMPPRLFDAAVRVGTAVGLARARIQNARIRMSRRLARAFWR